MNNVDLNNPPVGLENEFHTLLTPDAIDFLAELTTAFDNDVDRVSIFTNPSFILYLSSTLVSTKHGNIACHNTLICGSTIAVPLTCFAWHYHVLWQWTQSYALHYSSYKDAVHHDSYIIGKYGERQKSVIHLCAFFFPKWCISFFFYFNRTVYLITIMWIFHFIINALHIIDLRHVHSSNLIVELSHVRT